MKNIDQPANVTSTAEEDNPSPGDEPFSVESQIEMLATMDAAESPITAEAIADHLMSLLDMNSAPGGLPAS